MTTSFASLGLSPSLVNRLENIGFVTPTKIQSLAIPQILSGHDVVGQSQTGTGKTAAYSLPIIELIDRANKQVQALILTPTRELAQQVAEFLQDVIGDEKIYVLTVYGGQSIERQIRWLEKGVHIVVGTPGRIIDLLNRGNLRLHCLRYVVLDEADEMLSMGFIDDVKQILSQTPPPVKLPASPPPCPRKSNNSSRISSVTLSMLPAISPKLPPPKSNNTSILSPAAGLKPKPSSPSWKLKTLNQVLFLSARKKQLPN